MQFIYNLNIWNSYSSVDLRPENFYLALVAQAVCFLMSPFLEFILRSCKVRFLFPCLLPCGEQTHPASTPPIYVPWYSSPLEWLISFQWSVSFQPLWQIPGINRLWRGEDLFWLKISETAIPGHLALLFWGCSGTVPHNKSMWLPLDLWQPGNKRQGGRGWWGEKGGRGDGGKEGDRLGETQKEARVPLFPKGPLS